MVLMAEKAGKHNVSILYNKTIIQSFQNDFLSKVLVLHNSVKSKYTI